MPATIRPSTATRVTIRTVLALLAGAGFLVGAIYCSEWSSLRAGTHGVSFNMAPARPTWRRFEHPGIDSPAAVAREAATLGPDEEVIGIVAGGRARAYRLRALAHPERHIVNDRLGGVPVSVTYCDLTDCVRAFAGPPGDRPLDVSQAGLFGHEMILVIAGYRYRQRTGRPLADGPGIPPLPCVALDPRRTTWEDWTRLHPRTDIYVGPD